MSACRIEWLVPWLLAGCVSCSSREVAKEGPPPLTRDEMLDPRACQDCHPTHYREWASSMHAYAAKDPVFLAMNRKGQHDTGGELGTFCVSCHAPMAVREGAVDDPAELDAIPEHLQGVTCYFCHNAVGVGDHFNGDVVLANDTTMRAGIRDPVDPGAHRAEYSRHHDRNAKESSTLCGSCHDIVTPNGVHLERTLKEYEDSVFATPSGFDSCQGCHMDARDGVAARPPSGNVPLRKVHEHLFAGVDVALTDFPDREAQRRAVECSLATSARIVSVDEGPAGTFRVQLETSAGHNQPSGAAQDRRLWLEMVAYGVDGEVVFQRGVIADGEVEEKAPGQPGHDPNLRIYRDWIYDAEGQPTHDFWKAAPSTAYPRGYLSRALPAAPKEGGPHSIVETFETGRTYVERATLRLRMRPMGMDVLQELVAEQYLAEEIISEMPTFTVHGASVEWRRAERDRLFTLWPEDLACPDDYRCLLEPEAPRCGATQPP